MGEVRVDREVSAIQVDKPASCLALYEGSPRGVSDSSRQAGELSGFVCGKSAKCQRFKQISRRAVWLCTREVREVSAIQADKPVSSPAYDERTLAADKIKLRSAGKVR